MWTQTGTALGMFTFVPLGDMFPRRKLIVIMSLLSGLTVAMMAVAPNLALLNAAAFATGLTGIAMHLILPFAAKLAPPERRGHVVGTVLSGLLLGILLARLVSGFVGDLLGWRAMYWIAAGAMFMIAAVLRYSLPHDRPEPGLRYGELARSIVRLALTQPLLREAAILGGLLFGAFSSFWVTLVSFWEPRRTTTVPGSPGASDLLERWASCLRHGPAGCRIAKDRLSRLLWPFWYPSDRTLSSMSRVMACGDWWRA